MPFPLVKGIVPSYWRDKPVNPNGTDEDNGYDLFTWNSSLTNITFKETNRKRKDHIAYDTYSIGIDKLGKVSLLRYITMMTNTEDIWDIYFW